MQHQTQPTQGQVPQQTRGAELTTQRSSQPTQEPGAGPQRVGSEATQPGGGIRQPPGQQGMGLALQDVETPQQRAAVDAITRAIQVCEWCADQCIQLADPNMIECIRLCRDVSELGETALVLLPRSSRYAQAILASFEQAAQACRRECGHHSHAHCQECAQVLGGTSQAVQQLLASSGGQPMAQPAGGQ